MALVSPGIEVSIIDQSQYLPAAPSSVPFILVATAENKANAAGTAVAVATTAANANKLYRVTSQRDLVTLFGNPFFYKTTNGTSLQGYELNEYGLIAAYSFLGAANLCYIIRADIDLASLVGRVGRPSGAPADNTYWLDTANTSFGIFEFNAVTGNFEYQTPIVINDTDDLLNTVTGQPKPSIGNIGDYAVVFITDSNNFSVSKKPNTYDTYWFKDKTNNWVMLGGTDWAKNWPTVQGTTSNPTLTASDTFTVNGVTITVPVAPNNTVAGVASAINAAGVPFVTAAAISGKLEIYHQLDSTIVVLNSTGTALSAMGITSGTYYSPELFYGTNAQQPLWRSTDSQPHPTGSVWIKTNASNLGTNLAISKYNSATATYISQTCPLSASDWAHNASIDSTGGKNIPVGSIYAQYDFDSETFSAPLMLYRRLAEGASTWVGTTASPSFANSATFDVWVSTPGSSSLNGPYVVSMPGSGTLGASAFVTAWSAATYLGVPTPIPFTTAAVASTGAIELTHTEGGVIILNDKGVTSPASAVTAAGFTISTAYGSPNTVGAKWGPYKTITETGIVSTTSGSGVNATFTVSTTGYVPTFTVTNGGSGTYLVGDTLTIAGSSVGTFTVRVSAVNGSNQVTAVQWKTGFGTPQYMVQLSNWVPFSFVPNSQSPTLYPANNTNWYYSAVDQIDIMTNQGGVWKGYRNVAYASNGLPQATGTNQTDPNGPIISASVPGATDGQSDGTPLVYGDLWIDTSDLDNFPVIYRWQQVDAVDQWVKIDNTDQTTENGIVFADARWASSGTVDPVYDPLPSVTGLLTSNYLDLDAPDAQLYPQGTLLFNTRRSGYNVKQFRLNYFNAGDFPDVVLPAETSTWVSVSGLQSNGSPYMGRKAQRNMVVQALKASIQTNTEVREEDTFFNLIACPNYPELQPEMITLNNDRNQTSYIIGDTPLRLPDDATEIVAWATNAAGTTSTGEEGLVTRNTYMGLYYPSGITTDLSGAEVAVPASHMMLRTMIYNDTVAYPWFAPAGQRRGIIDNATNIGYINATTGEFVTTKNRVGLRDVEYTNFINPLAYFTNIGILNFGNKNSFDSQSALDRTNVARLVAYIRYQLQVALRPFIFEPNDNITRSQVQSLVQTLLADIQSKRGVYDYLVVCDESNNTPARIDRNELWVDVAIEPVKAVEFIYIPVRILNTGEIAGLSQNG
jgi:hypothetical protein